MKLPKHEFKKLQQEWYEKLAELGFEDIEKLSGEEFVLSQTASYCFRRNADAFSREMKEQYFRAISQAVNDEETVFRNEVDRYILLRHSEGANVKTIREELILKGSSRHRHSIRFIIRRYENIWGIKYYEPEQLNIKKKA